MAGPVARGAFVTVSRNFHPLWRHTGVFSTFSLRLECILEQSDKHDVAEDGSAEQGVGEVRCGKDVPSLDE